MIEFLVSHYPLQMIPDHPDLPLERILPSQVGQNPSSSLKFLLGNFLSTDLYSATWLFGVEPNLSPILQNPIAVVSIPIEIVLNSLPFHFNKCQNNFSLTLLSDILRRERELFLLFINLLAIKNNSSALMGI